MAISSLSFACRPSFPFRPSLFHRIQKVRFSSVAAIKTLDVQENVIKGNSRNLGDFKAPEWRKLSSKELGIGNSLISGPTKKVLNGLKKKGYEVYLVGGCVRDLILKRIPKDFDIITSAELKEVVRAFSRCEIVGKWFPICHVHIGDTIVEVSSFSTIGRKFKVGLRNDIGCPIDCDEKDYLRWKNCLQRDFTINGLMFDPYKRIVYDYMGGLEDIKKAKVRTVIPANNFFSRGPCSNSALDKPRIMMEMNYMLAYGSAEASLRILWKFGLLELLLPFQAAYFVRDGFKRRDKRSNMLLCLFSNLDKLLAPDRPCHNSLWVGILAFHRALVDQPRDPMVVAAFCLAVHNGGDILGGVNMARKITKPHDTSFHELTKPQDLDSEVLINEVVDFAASVKQVLSWMTDEHYVSLAMAEYPQAPYSDLVFFPLAVYLRVCRIFKCSKEGPEKGFMPKQGRKIDYEMLGLGRGLQEVRHTFARVVFDTVYPLN
ncbi:POLYNUCLEOTIDE ADENYLYLTRANSFERASE FAMILY PROTEIN-RELATED [Salix viminalis]|uniref:POLYNUCLEOTIDE ADENYLYLTRANSFERASE FAMILY PROTEIN-RELATED n=1 Tax=Salix viminalis TaxID=40686 RepID=A0A9Q0NLV0_SALVM|nr:POLYNUCLEOTIDE ADENYLYLTRANSFERASE FAMILY PROTEIN-RELATED [Salix viminalis]